VVPALSSAATAIRDFIRESMEWPSGPAILSVRPRFFPNADHQPSSEQIFHAVRSAIGTSGLRG